MTWNGSTLGSRLERLIPVAYSDLFWGAVYVRMLSAFSSARIVGIGNGEVASFRRNHSVVVSSLVVALDPGDPALLVLCLNSIGRPLGVRFRRRLPVAYSEIWYSGFGWFWSNPEIAASKVCIALIVLGDLEARELEWLTWLRNL